MLWVQSDSRSHWAISGFVIAALCYVSKGICSREDTLLNSKAHLLCIYNIMWENFSISIFLLPLADCVFISSSAGFVSPRRMCVCELWWKLSNSSAFDCKATDDIFEMSEPALSTHTSTKPWNNDTSLQLFHPDGGSEQMKIRVSISLSYWHDSQHIFTSALVEHLLVGIFGLDRIHKWSVFPYVFSHSKPVSKQSLKGQVFHFCYVKSSIHLTSTDRKSGSW